MMKERQDLIWKTPEVKCTYVQGGLFSSEKVDLPLKMRSIWVDTRMMKKQWPWESLRKYSWRGGNFVQSFRGRNRFYAFESNWKEELVWLEPTEWVT